jgi:7-cyano-7-deazaguanine synthase
MERQSIFRSLSSQEPSTLFPGPLLTGWPVFLWRRAASSASRAVMLLKPKKHDSAAVLLLSGGLDSMVAGGLAREAGYRLFALTIDYNQRHRVELQAAARVATMLGVERHIILPLDLSQFGGSALTDNAIAVPKTGVTAGIPPTYVPARNTIFLSVALGWAEAIGARDLVIGINALDYSGYPDCRPAFVEAFEAMAVQATKAGVEGDGFRVHAPLVAMTKADIACEAARLGMDVSQSWSCYDPAADGAPCGQCDSCQLRAKGFAEAGITDTLLS